MYILIPLGILLFVIAALLLAIPEAGFEFGRKHFLSSSFQYGIGALSIVLSVAIYYSASTTKFPTVFEIFALISMIRGVISVALPPSDFKSIVSWELKVFSPYGRVIGVLYALIGGFLIYAAA